MNEEIIVDLLGLEQRFLLLLVQIRGDGEADARDGDSGRKSTVLVGE